MAVRNSFKKATKRVGKAFGFSEINDQLAIIKQLLEKNDTNNQIRMDQIVNSINELKQQNQSLFEKIDRLEKINELYFHALFKQSNESDDDMKKRFFKKLPAASGDLLLIQKGNTKLLKAFNTICEQNKIPYWIHGGTLLGALRHGSSIPWDDDADVCMMRDDIHKLEKVLEKTNYRITIVYDAVNVSKQLRFRSKDKNVPCFIDIFIFDYAAENKTSTWQKWKEKRNNIIEQTRKSKNPVLIKWQEQIISDHNDNTQMSHYLDNYYEKLYGDIFGPVHTGGPGKVITEKELKTQNHIYIIDGLDNMTPIANPDSPRLYEKSIIFPTKKITYDGIKLSAPNKYDVYLRRLYGDYLEIPKDLVTHFQHIKRADLNTKAIQEFLETDH